MGGCADEDTFFPAYPRIIGMLRSPVQPARQMRSRQHSAQLTRTLSWSDETMDDTSLVQPARNGDNEATARLITHYRELLYAAGYSVLGSRDEAEDLAQDAAVRIFTKIRSFRESNWVERTGRGRSSRLQSFGPPDCVQRSRVLPLV